LVLTPVGLASLASLIPTVAQLRGGVIMGVKIDHSIRQIEEATLVNFKMPPLHSSERCCRNLSVKPFNPQSKRINELAETIVAVLDRDDKLRHDYLQRRWQGEIG
jgi:hypothetical protein